MSEKVVTQTRISMRRKKPVAVFGSDSPYFSTGFANQCGHIASIAAKKMKWDVHYLGWQTRGNIEIKGYPYKIHGIMGRAAFGKDSYTPLFGYVNPDVVFTQGDAHMVDQLGTIPRPFWIWYYPIDGHPINQIIGSVLPRADVRVAMSKYGRNLVKMTTGLDSEYIPHGVDTTMFSPANKNECRTAFFDMYGLKPRECETEEAFIIGSVARLNLRKHHLRLLIAFKKFLDTGSSKQEIEEKKKKCYLYLHLDPFDPLFVPDMNHDYLFMEWIDALGLNKNVVITPKKKADGSSYDYVNGIPQQDLVLLYNSFDIHALSTGGEGFGIDYVNGIPQQDLVLLYNSFDIHALSTGGEGFGIPIVEAMACGKPNIVTDYTTTRELIASDDEDVYLPLDQCRGMPVPPSRLWMERCGVNKAWIDVDAMALAFETYYKNRELIDTQSKIAREWAVTHFDWKVVDKMWIDVFEKVNYKVELV